MRSWFRSLEVTYNKDRDDYHPHFHALLMVPHHYFYKDRGLYIPHEKWLDLWKKSMRDDRITQVDIRKVKSREQGSLESLAGKLQNMQRSHLLIFLRMKKGRKKHLQR